MQLLVYLFIALFAAAIANDYLLARRVRRAVEMQRLNSPELDGFRFGGSPLGIVLNVFRLRKIPVPHELSDPDHFAIRVHYRVQQVLVASLVGCVAVALLRGGAA
ncbi:hypothetical protein ACFWZU_16220 [Frateuria sp. GZRR33]|uniref:hypothetical protein n=1 Tax=Frateuria sp. GZRR33 TaxID=3351535 RepID=UPI003EDC4F5A